jgi:hypothetical protein
MIAPKGVLVRRWRSAFARCVPRFSRKPAEDYAGLRKNLEDKPGLDVSVHSVRPGSKVIMRY